MKTRKFRELLIWQESMSLAREVYAVTHAFPRDEMVGLTSQLRRAAISVPSNIAEGHGRTSDKSFAVFWARLAGRDLRWKLSWNWLPASAICRLKGFLHFEGVSAFLEQCEKITRMLNALLRTLRTGP